MQSERCCPVSFWGQLSSCSILSAEILCATPTPTAHLAATLQVGADAVVRLLAQTGLDIVGAVPATMAAPSAAATAGHLVLSGTPQEPYANPRHPDAQPGERTIPPSICMWGSWLCLYRRHVGCRPPAVCVAQLWLPCLVLAFQPR